MSAIFIEQVDYTPEQFAMVATYSDNPHIWAQDVDPFNAVIKCLDKLTDNGILTQGIRVIPVSNDPEDTVVITPETIEAARQEYEARREESK